MSKIKLNSRERTKFRIRKKVFGKDERPRVSVFKSSKHTYAQVISDIQGKTVVSASTLDPEVVDTVKKIGGDKNSTKSVAAAKAVGMVLAKRSKEKNIEVAVFDRNGFSYTGRIQAVADGMREGGLKI